MHRHVVALVSALGCMNMQQVALHAYRRLICKRLPPGDDNHAPIAFAAAWLTNWLTDCLPTICDNASHSMAATNHLKPQNYRRLFSSEVKHLMFILIELVCRPQSNMAEKQPSDCSCGGNQPTAEITGEFCFSNQETHLDAKRRAQMVIEHCLKCEANSHMSDVCASIPKPQNAVTATIALILTICVRGSLHCETDLNERYPLRL